MADRLDMFWIKYSGSSGNFTWAIDQDLRGNFVLSLQYSKPEDSKPSRELTERAREYFLNSPEYGQMLNWATSLESGGYEIFWSSLAHESCPVCGFHFQKGTSHKHDIGNEYHPFLPYHGKEEKRMTEEILRGRKASGRYFYSSEPSLEDMGYTSEMLKNKSVAKLVQLGVPPEKITEVVKEEKIVGEEGLEL
jgi:hypothetical protein